MATIVGLHSGKEFLVQDNSYTMYPEGAIIHVFISADDKRVITVNHADIEFFDEPKTENRINHLKELAEREIPKQAVGVDYA